MSDVRPAVPTRNAFYVGCVPCNDDAHILLAVQCTWDLAHDNACAVTVIAPTREQFRTHSALRRLPRGTGKETPRTMHAGNVAPVVVACWPDERTLKNIESLPNLRDLFVVPGAQYDVEPWRIAHSAVDLLAFG